MLQPIPSEERCEDSYLISRIYDDDSSIESVFELQYKKLPQNIRPHVILENMEKKRIIVANEIFKTLKHSTPEFIPHSITSLHFKLSQAKKTKRGEYVNQCSNICSKIIRNQKRHI